MKRILKNRLAPALVLIAAAGLLLSSCGDGGRLFAVTFDVAVDIPQQWIPGNPGPDPVSLYPGFIPPQEINLSDYPTYIKAGFSTLKRVYVTRLSLKIDAISNDSDVDALEPDPPTPDDFSFIESASISVLRFGDEGAPLTKIIAYVDAGDPQLEPGSDYLVMKVTERDIHKYIKDNKFSLVFDAEGVLPPDDVYLSGRAVCYCIMGL